LSIVQKLENRSKETNLVQEKETISTVSATETENRSEIDSNELQQSVSRYNDLETVSIKAAIEMTEQSQLEFGKLEQNVDKHLLETVAVTEEGDTPNLESKSRKRKSSRVPKAAKKKIAVANGEVKAKMETVTTPKPKEEKLVTSRGEPNPPPDPFKTPVKAEAAQEQSLNLKVVGLPTLPPPEVALPVVEVVAKKSNESDVFGDRKTESVTPTIQPEVHSRPGVN
jgi:hypothetical protein